MKASEEQINSLLILQRGEKSEQKLVTNIEREIRKILKNFYKI